MKNYNIIIEIKYINFIKIVTSYLIVFTLLNKILYYD